MLPHVQRLVELIAIPAPQIEEGLGERDLEQFRELVIYQLDTKRLLAAAKRATIRPLANELEQRSVAQRLSLEELETRSREKIVLDHDGAAVGRADAVDGNQLLDLIAKELAFPLGNRNDFTTQQLGSGNKPVLAAGNRKTVEFLAFALCASYLMFLAVYLREYEAKEIAERERWMLATRDSAAIKELEAWRQSGRELSVLRHDMRHYLRGLAVLIKEGHTDEALGRIGALCEANDRTAVRRYCANETVNIALSSLSADINAHGITADLRAAVPETVHVGNVDLFGVVSNALDNAIAAASAAPEGKRFVDLDLRYEDGQLLLLVSNTFGRAPHMVDGMPVAQHTGHGFGTKSIMLAVERMNGNCQFSINGDRFELRAVM